jgi:hypothetical protein
VFFFEWDIVPILLVWGLTAHSEKVLNGKSTIDILVRTE